MLMFTFVLLGMHCKISDFCDQILFQKMMAVGLGSPLHSIAICYDWRCMYV